MPEIPESIRRKEALAVELAREIKSELSLALWCHRGSIILMSMALASSVLAGVLGFFTNASSKWVGAFAVLPALIGFVAKNLKLEEKNSWHARMYDELRGLRSKLLYEQPEIPELGQVARIASDWRTLEAKMQSEWDRTLLLNWSGFSSHHGAPSQPNESSAAQGRD